MSKTGKTPPNVELVKKLYELTNKYNIKYKHVEAHTDRTDRHSIGNYNADKLANSCLGVKKETSFNDKEKEKKIYLNVPYSKKDEAKAKGARWDAPNKKWYILESNLNKESLMKLFKN